MIMQRRKKIDNFLIELEKYCVDNQLKQINWMDFYMFLQNTWDTKIMNSLWSNKRIIKLPNLCIFLNWFRAVSNNLNSSTGKIYTRISIKATWITEYSMRRIAYSLEWIEVKEINYKHFFDKHSFNFALHLPNTPI
jgi:hypothetical protein